MLVREGDRTCLEAPANAEPADSVVTRDYYTQLPQIRLTDSSTIVQCSRKHQQK
jgi:hypothetical protein